MSDLAEIVYSINQNILEIESSLDEFEDYINHTGSLRGRGHSAELKKCVATIRHSKNIIVKKGIGSFSTKKQDQNAGADQNPDDQAEITRAQSSVIDAEANRLEGLSSRIGRAIDTVREAVEIIEDTIIKQKEINARTIAEIKEVDTIGGVGRAIEVFVKDTITNIRDCWDSLVRLFREDFIKESFST